MKKSQKNKKMSDIAELAGVSESTVSRALSNSPLVNQKTRERIQALANEHHYEINKQAQNLRLQSSRTISVVIPVDHEPRQHISDPFFLELLGSIADAITESEYDLLLSRAHKADWRKKIMRHNYVDGVIIIGQSDLHDDINDFAKRSQVPMVVWGAKLDGQQYVSVGSDNALGGKLATEYLVQRGRKRLIFLGDAELPEVKLRYQGFCSALQTAELPVMDSHLISCSFTKESATENMRKALHLAEKKKEKFDGIVAASDVLALSAIKVLAEAKIAVPEDVSVVGYDDISIAHHMSPSLTTVSQEIYQAGQALVSSLFAQLAGEDSQSIIIPPRLIVRETS